jgi:glycopeptide antibiotics resistance protein
LRSFVLSPLIAVGVIVTLLVAVLLAPAVARRLGAHPVVAGLLIFSVGIILTATLTPDAEAFRGIVSSGRCDTSRIGLIPLRELVRVNEASANVALFVPLGIAVALLPRTRASAIIAIGAISLTFIVEGTQLLVPLLSRGCQTADLFDNLLGLGVGAVIGICLRLVLPRGRSNGDA